jgi:hypothetical protein
MLTKSMVRPLSFFLARRRRILQQVFLLWALDTAHLILCVITVYQSVFYDGFLQESTFVMGPF